MRTVAIYARTSSDDETDKNGKVSLKDQVQQCTDYANSNGWSIQYTFIERNRSGRSYPLQAKSIAEEDIEYIKYFKNSQMKPYRDKLTELLNILDDIDAIVVVDESRLFRPLRNSYLKAYIVQKLNSHDVVLEQVLGGAIDYNKFGDSLLSSISQDVQDQSIKVLVEKTRTGKITAKDEGKIIGGGHCYGIRSAYNQKLKIIESEAKIIREIYARFLKNKNMAAIVRWLNDNKVPTMKNVAMWDRVRVNKILTRLLYTGKQYNSKGMIIDCKAMPSPIIELATWLQVQNLLDKNKRYTNARKGIIHALSGLLYCGYCGRALVITYGSSLNGNVKSSYYDCRSAEFKTNNEGCKRVRIREHSIKHSDDVTGIYESLLPVTFISVVEHIKILASDKNLLPEIHELEKKLNIAEQEETNLLRLKLKGEISERLFVKSAKESEKLKDEYINNLEKLKRAIVSDKQQEVDRLQKYLRDLHLESLSPIDYRELIHDIIKKIVVFPYFFEIYLNNGKSFYLERVPIRNTRSAPPYVYNIVMTEDNENDIGNFTLDIHYLYKSAFNSKGYQNEIIKNKYSDGRINIYSIGMNPQYNQSGRKKDKRLPDIIVNPPLRNQKLL